MAVYKLAIGVIPLVGLYLCLAIAAPSAFAEEADIAVLYPDVPAPYSSVFTDIVEGIEKGYDGRVRSRVLPQSISAPKLEAWLESRNIVRVIALGKQAMDLMQVLPENYVTVAGAVLSVPPVVNETFSAITLAPDPDLTFAELKRLAPKVEIVSVIYHKSYHAHLIQRASEVAARHGITLELHAANGARADAQLYHEFFEAKDAKRRSVWLLQGDKSLQNRSILYNLLKDAWYSKLLVFSNNPSYVKKGILFSLFPDNIRMGESLAAAMEQQNAGKSIGVVQTRDLLSALNIRTAEHLGLPLSRSKRREFDVVFPSR